ncbi:MAG: hypothetical protein ABIH72_04355 [archaeon]
MIKKSELGHFLLAVIVLAFVGTWSLKQNLKGLEFLWIASLFLIILAINMIVKKIVAYYYSTDIDIKIWSFQRFGFKEYYYFKVPIPIGILLTFLLSIATMGLVPWYAVLQYDAKPHEYRAARRHGFYSYSELTEFHIGVIAIWGMAVLLILAFFAYLINIEDLAVLTIAYVAFNMLPISQLDGCKIFFGSLIWWFILAVITLIGIAYTVLL